MKFLKETARAEVALQKVENLMAELGIKINCNQTFEVVFEGNYYPVESVNSTAQCCEFPRGTDEFKLIVKE